jgi:hypothetical protein
LSNQVFSILAVLLIFKFRRATWPRFVDVRRHTFGLYLSHSFVVLFIIRLLNRFPQLLSGSIYARGVEGILIWIAAFVVVYASCLMVTTWLANQPSLQWTVGLASEDRPSRPDLQSVDVPGLLRSQ